MSALQHASERTVLVVAEPQPDTASPDLQTQFKSVAIPLVDQTVATSDQFAHFGDISKVEFLRKLLPCFGPEAAMPPGAISEIHVDEVLVCAEAAPLGTLRVREGQR